MFKNKEFFIYAYLVLLRGMSNDKNEKRKLRDRIYKIELPFLLLRNEFDAFMYKYGLNKDWLN
jgi:hypothetical protein